MLSNKQKEKLIANWGEKADSLHCFAEVRVYDPLSSWECYIFALNPEDNDEVQCIVKVSKAQEATVEKWYLTNIKCLFNEYGEGVDIDDEYRPRRADYLLNKLNNWI